MMRSLTTAVSALRNHQTKMDVVGNNIANVNTVGFKSESVRFQDIFNQTLQNASASSANRGGTNPVQVGLGMSISAITTMHTQGVISPTGRDSDLAISGSGFFVVADQNGYYYTRDGSFLRDPGGELVNSAGIRVMGWAAEVSYVHADGTPANVFDIDAIEVYTVNPNGPLTSINIPLREDMSAHATENMLFAGNLDAATEEYDPLDPNPVKYEYISYFYDSLGNRYNVIYQFAKIAENQWMLVSGDDTDPTNVTGSRFYDINGNIVAIDFDDVSPLNFTPGGTFYVVDDPTDPRYDPLHDPPNYSFNIPAVDLGLLGTLEVGARDINITMDFTWLNQLSKDSEVVNKGQDGYAAGEMVSYSIDQNGLVTGNYSNGMMRLLGQIALASFANPEGLMKIGDNLYTVTVNSGDASVGPPGAMGRGFIQSRALELSNVDLALEFTEMITTSRGYQAQARVITTSDEMLIELINIKR